MYLVILILLTLLACNKNQQAFEDFNRFDKPRKEISLKYFTVKCTNLPSMNNEFSKWGDFFDYYGEYSTYPYKEYRIYSYDKMNHLFSNTYLEIQFPHRYLFKSIPNTLHCFIGNGYRDSGMVDSKNCFYILWVNNIKRADSLKVHNTWEISSLTDTIISNIDENEIKQLYPEFKGKVVDGKINEIIIKDDYKTDNFWFYQEIEFVGFNRYYDGYQKYKDSLHRLGKEFPPKETKF